MPNALAEKGLLLEVVTWLTRLQHQHRLAGHWGRSREGVYIPRHYQLSDRDRARATPEARLREEVEEEVIRRTMARLQQEAVIQPGTADFYFLWRAGSGVIELKRDRAPREPDLFRRNHPRPAGRPSERQVAYRESCLRHGIRYAVCRNLGEVEDTLVGWGFIPGDNAESRQRFFRRAVPGQRAG